MKVIYSLILVMDRLLDAAGQTSFLVSLVSVALIVVIISIKQTMHQEANKMLGS